MKKHQNYKRETLKSEDGIILISGRWGYITTYYQSDEDDEPVIGEVLRFLITFRDKKGNIRKAASRSAFTYDINRAVMQATGLNV